MPPSHSRRSVLVTAGTALGLGLAGCSSLLDGTQETPTSSTETTGAGTGTGTPGTASNATSVAGLGVAATDTDYAVLGSADARKTATLYGGWKCPYTKEFVLQMLPPIIERYMAPGDLAMKFRAVRFQADESWGDDEPRANRGGQTVWHKAHEQFPEYVETLYRNQPSEQTRWATIQKLIAFAEQAGIADTQPIKESITAGEYTARWKNTMEVVSEKGIAGIPRFELGREITAPILDPEATEQQLKQALE